MNEKRTNKPIEDLLISLSNLCNADIYRSATSEDIDIVLNTIGVDELRSKTRQIGQELQ